MSLTRLRLGYLPLTDAAPLIVAAELGFAAEEGLAFDLVALQSWAQSRDMLGLGAVDAAQMLVPLPIAQTLGLGPAYPPFDLLMVLSVGGEAIAVSARLAEALRARGHGFALNDPAAARTALAAVAGPEMTVGVPFPFSTHTELVWRWWEGGETGVRLTIRTVPPPRMAEALSDGEVDAFCVGEPWASHAVERGAGTLLLAGRAIWAAPPEKGLVVTREFSTRRPDETGRLMRAVWRACRWLDVPGNRATAAEILSRPAYLDLPPELVERGLMDRLHVSAAGEVRRFPGFIRFHDGAANFPARSLAAGFARRIARQHGLEVETAMQAATGCFRPDLYRQHLRADGAELPADSAPTARPQGELIRPADAAVDGEIPAPPFTAR